MPPFLSSDVRDLINQMLRVNPSERISVTKVLHHKWLTKRLELGNKPPVPLKPASVSRDEAFECCQLLFPRLSEQVLKDKIKNYGYHTATYLLLKDNEPAMKAIRESHFRLQPQQNQPVDSMFLFTNESICSKLSCHPADLNRVALVKRKLNLDFELSENTPNSTPKAKRLRDGAPSPKIILAVRPKPVDFNDSSLRASIGVTRTPDNRIINSKTAKKVLSPKPRVKQNIECKTADTPSKLTTLTNTAEQKKVVSPKPIVKQNVECKTSDTPSKLATLTNSAEQKKIIKSPLRPIKNQMLTPETSSLVTPKRSAKKSMTKMSLLKKSLLKRFMAATPAKSNSPRELLTSTNSNNITMTSFQDPQKCLDRLVYNLTAKGVDCKQKEYGKVPSTSTNAWRNLTFVVRKRCFGTY